MEPGLAAVMMPTEEGQTAHADIIRWYGAAVGCLMYAMTMTRPDLAYALSMVSRYCHNPDSTHVAAVQRIFRYIQGTLDYGVGYQPDQQEFHGYSDADWGGAVDRRESTGAYIYFIAGGPVSWCSKRQDAVALSSCESEYYALSEAGKEAIWLRRLLTETGQISQGPSLIWADNQGAIAVAENPEFHRRMKHVDIKYHWVRKAIEDGAIQVEYISTALMAADGLTKPLGPMQFTRFLTLIGMAH